MKKGSQKGRQKPTDKHRLSVRQEKFVEGILQGKSGAQAVRDAGYKTKNPRDTAAKIHTNSYIQERIKARVAESGVESNEVIGTLASQMRADLSDILPEDEILKRARENSVSHLIKKLKVKTYHTKSGNKVITHELEMYSAQEAAKQLCNVMGLNKELAKNPQDAARAAFERLQQEYEDVPKEIIAQRIARIYNIEESDLIH